ncbi:co-chaperone GroES [Vibrio sp. PP-XX7]
MKLKPLHDWVVIVRDAKPAELNGLWRPDTPSNQGTVIAVGPLVQELEPGDRVQFNRYAGVVLSGAIDVTMVHEVDVFGIIL